jgi:type III pantothenate kinase
LLLAGEVGNSNTLFGLFDLKRDELVTSWRLSTDRDRMPDDWFALLSALFQAGGYALAGVDAVILSSVVPAVTTALHELARDRLGVTPIVVDTSHDLGVRLLVDEPDKLGADRLVDGIAAYAKYGGPAIIIDLGTATTIDAISAGGDFLGGAIATGVTTSLKALSANAAQLFNIELRLPHHTLGKNTIDQLRIGIVLGQLALLEGLVVRMKRELGVEDLPVILTGGLAPLFAGQSPLFTHHDPELTLTGLRLVYQKLMTRNTTDAGVA